MEQATTDHVLGHAPASSLQAIQGTALRPSRDRKLDLQSEHSWCKAQRAASDTGHEAFCGGDPPTAPSAAAGLHRRGGHPSHRDALRAQTLLLLRLQLCFATRWHRSLRNALFYQYSILSQSQIQAAASALFLVVATNTYKLAAGKGEQHPCSARGWMAQKPARCLSTSGSIHSPTCYLTSSNETSFFLPAIVMKYLCKAASQ